MLLPGISRFGDLEVDFAGWTCKGFRDLGFRDLGFRDLGM